MSTKPSRSGSPNTKKSEEMSDSAEPSIRQDIGQTPVIHASRAEENAVHWIQLLHALDQPDFLGWPLMTPIKLPLQKCKKCSLEFCSPINYRRHIRVHRQSSTLNKESSRNKDLLAAFWDKLPLEKAKELVAFNEATLKEIPGASIVTALASSLCNPAVWALPHVYVRAGSLLLDIVQATPSRQPISSQELFGILDDASEKTFLCGGTPESVQNYLFDGEATKTCLEFKNLVASTSFLLEQQLVKACVADKDAEALRCQKLLVEEEEAAKKRFAELAKRKKQKKLRRKEHKLKELSHQCEGDLNVAVNAAETPVLAQVSVPSYPSDSRPNSIYGLENCDSGIESLQNQEEGLEAQIDSSSGDIIQGDSETVESQIACISNSTYGPENIDAGLESPQSPEKDLEGQIDICSEGITQGDTENIESQMAGESNSIHGPENVDAGLESPQHPEKEVEVQNDLSSINQGDTESIDSQMVGESDSIHGPENVNAGLESPQHPEKEVEVQHDLNSGVINQGDKESIDSQMVGESDSIHGPENVNAGLESPQHPEKEFEVQHDLNSGVINQGDTESIDSQMVGESDSIHGPENVNAGLESPQHPEKEEVEVQNDLSSRVINKGDTESIDSQMVGESDSIHGPENLEVGFESKTEKDLKAEIDASSGGVTKGETETVDSHKVCESNQETRKFYSLTPLNRSRVSTKKDKMGSCGNFVKSSLVDGKCDHEHFVETEIEVLIGSISCKVNIPPFVTIGDIVVTEKAGYPIMFRKGPSVPTPYNHCVNQNHALSSNNGLQGITPAAAKEFMRQSM